MQILKEVLLDQSCLALYRMNEISGHSFYANHLCKQIQEMG